MPKGYYKSLTNSDYKYILENYLKMPVKKLARQLNITSGRIMRLLKKEGLSIPKEVIERNKQSSYFKKGRVPENKGKKQSEYMSPEAIEKTKSTRFQKGHLPHNTKHDGFERISKDGYIEIRVSLGVYEKKHRVLWEKHYGEIPEAHCVVFKDGNPLNCTIDNLELISRIENMYRNSRHGFPKEIIPSKVLTKKIENKLKSLKDG